MVANNSPSLFAAWWRFHKSASTQPTGAFPGSNLVCLDKSKLMTRASNNPPTTKPRRPPHASCGPMAPAAEESELLAGEQRNVHPPSSLQMEDTPIHLHKPLISLMRTQSISRPLLFGPTNYNGQIAPVEHSSTPVPPPQQGGFLTSACFSQLPFGVLFRPPLVRSHRQVHDEQDPGPGSA